MDPNVTSRCEQCYTLHSVVAIRPTIVQSCLGADPHFEPPPCALLVGLVDLA